jgi:SAM-dependent methyltransferase
MKFKNRINNIFLRLYIKYFPVNQKTLWNLWANVFIEDKEQTTIHPWIDHALNIIIDRKPNTTLEVGVGFGRNIIELRRRGFDINNTHGIDLSVEMIKMAKSRLPDISSQLKVGNILNYSSVDKFDLVFVPFVFMHIKPDLLPTALNNVFTSARKDILIIDEYNSISDSFEINKYTYAHDLNKLCTNQFKEFDLKSYKVYGKWQLLHFEKI